MYEPPRPLLEIEADVRRLEGEISNQRKELME